MQCCILVIDDVRRVIALSLQQVMPDWEVLEAAGGQQGIACALLFRPDAILLDVMMPGMDGPEVLHRLRTARTTADIPVVLLTARALARDRAILSALPVAGILLKPFDPLTLAHQVRTILGWAEKRIAV